MVDFIGVSAYIRSPHYIKSFIDILIAVIGISIFLIPMAVIALIIKCSSKGSVLYKQKRIGQYGEEFEIYKFRTMIEGAENYTSYLTPEQVKEFRQNNCKLKGDPRITTIGKFLRKYSLDELPQLFNVLKRDMSIVGPRPVTEEELHKFKENCSTVLSVKPGITGLAQVNGRSNITFDHRMNMDIQYVHSRNNLLDILIIFKTIRIVLKIKGI